MIKESTRDGRFIKAYVQGTMETMEIWIDSETGVNYLYRHCGYSGGLTPMINADGKPIVTPISKE